MTTSRPYKFRISALESADGKDSLRYDFYIDPLQIHSIVFKGGGMRVFLYQKFLEIIEENGVLAKAREVGASSSGALAAFFAAIPFEQGKRTEAMDQFSQTTEGTDVMENNLLWNTYRLATLPLSLFSKTMGWASNSVSSVANQFNNIPLGSIISAPLNILSWGLNFGTYATPKAPIALFNALVYGGLFLGKELQTNIRDAIQTHTKNALQALLDLYEAQEVRETIDQLLSIGLLVQGSELGNLIINPDLTFRHFHHLANLRGSQFKEIFITGVRKKDFDLKIFNYTNTPDMTIHKAVRISMSIPHLYQDVEHEGEAHIDGGCVNNYPIRHATPQAVDPLLQKFGINDNQARLGVRVEYPHEIQEYLWRKPNRSLAQRLTLEITRLSHKRITRIDSYATDADVTKEMQQDFAQRSIQMDDQGVSLTEFGIDQEKRQRSLAAAEAPLREYFKNHENEKAYIKSFNSTQAMQGEWAWMRDCLLEVLTQPQSYEVFCVPGKDALELEVLRQEIIDQLRPSTAIILSRIFASEIWPALEPVSTATASQIPAEQQTPSGTKKPEPQKDFSLEELVERFSSLKPGS